MDAQHRNALLSQGSAPQKFFQGQAADPLVEKIKQKIFRQEQEKPFISDFVSWAGFPLWNKALAPSGPIGGTRTEGGRLQIVYVPFSKDSSTSVAAVLLAVINANDTTLQMVYRWQYNQLPYKSATATGATAEAFALFFMGMEKETFGRAKFHLTDTVLFRHDTLGGPHAYMTVHDFSIARNTAFSFSICVDTQWQIDDGQLHGCPVDNPDCIPGEQCTTYDFGGSDGTGSSGSGSGFPLMGGGGTGGGGNWNENPCRNIPSGGSNPCNGTSGSNGGWEPLTPDIPPYACTYQLTSQEQSIFNQLDQEDQVSNNNHQNLDCQGTKRAGNIYFQGTKEHWLIQIDYVAKNFLYGDREFAIPNAGNIPNARGYVDLVNLQNGNMFEIKPNNPDGIATGDREIANYVAKGNLFCTNALPSGTVWNTGSIYTTVMLPTSTPNRYLQATLVNPGIIGYSYITTTNPVPAPPIVVPTSIFDKLKVLIDRLKNNLSNADVIIAEFCQQNPDVVNYIKAAAIGAGVAIIVSTILEDIVTAGAGIADDWASFLAAYRLVRFALAL